MGVGILAKRVVLELGSSTNFVYSLRGSFLKSSLFFWGKLEGQLLFCDWMKEF